ncbi:oligopeptide transporter, OPT superfamily [Artemisia annua]|uniref:Oligopeptide transporter, OPT superfamily n=1 Tax=Artemisia annua TaxID=35608 RepID=A0A2U1PEP5_ARTAN|nr:oligopeptide transporter, OPT superfamily [Artemisia annua]
MGSGGTSKNVRKSGAILQNELLLSNGNSCTKVVYKRFKGWWARHNYILSAGLDAGVAFMAILCYFALQIWDINGPKWWGIEIDDHCPLAICPTAPGIKVDGCPQVY